MPREQVDDAIERTDRRYDVLELACDPLGWQGEIEQWQAAYGTWWSSSRPRRGSGWRRRATGSAPTSLEGMLAHDGDPVLAAHVGHCVAKVTPYGTVVDEVPPGLAPEDRLRGCGDDRLRAGGLACGEPAGRVRADGRLARMSHAVRIPEKGLVRRLVEPLVAWARGRDDPPRNPNLPPGFIQVGIGENGRPIIGRLAARCSFAASTPRTTQARTQE